MDRFKLQKTTEISLENGQRVWLGKSVSSLTPTSAIIYDAYTSIKKIKNKKYLRTIETECYKTALPHFGVLLRQVSAKVVFEGKI